VAFLLVIVPISTLRIIAWWLDRSEPTEESEKSWAERERERLKEEKDAR
jgi:hypothetical protein